MTPPRFKPAGDGALLVEFGDTIDDALHRQVVALDRALGRAEIPGVREVVPALVNLLIVFDPITTAHDAIRSAVEALFPLPDLGTEEARHHEVPVCFDATITPDLAAVAEACKMRIEAVIDALTGVDLEVSMYGFAPGYAYLTGVPDGLRVPRKKTPKPNVPKGSVLIAGPQSLITTLTMPTGWSIIGRSPFEVMQSGEGTSFQFDVGDTVRYVPIGREALPAGMRVP